MEEGKGAGGVWGSGVGYEDGVGGRVMRPEGRTGGWMEGVGHNMKGTTRTHHRGTWNTGCQRVIT